MGDHVLRIRRGSFSQNKVLPVVKVVVDEEDDEEE